MDCTFQENSIMRPINTTAPREAESAACDLQQRARALKKGESPDFTKCIRKTRKRYERAGKDPGDDCTQFESEFDGLRPTTVSLAEAWGDELSTGMANEIAAAPGCQALRWKHAGALARCLARSPDASITCEARFLPKYDAVASRRGCVVPAQDGSAAINLTHVMIGEIEQAIARGATPSTGNPCVSTADCGDGQACISGTCLPEACAENNGGCEAFSKCLQGPVDAVCGGCPHGYQLDPVDETGCRPEVRVTADPVYLGATEPPSCGVRIAWRSAMEVGVPAVSYYEIHRNGEFLAERTIPIYEDWSAGPGQHDYAIVSVHADGTRTRQSAPAQIFTIGCDDLTDPAGYRIRDIDLWSSPSSCTQATVQIWSPDVATYPVWGVRYFVNGRKTSEDITDYGGTFPDADNWHGLDALVPDRVNVFSFAPFYDEDGTKVGPLAEASVQTRSCLELGNLGLKDVAVVLARPKDHPAPNPFDVAYAEGVFNDFEYSARAYFDEVSRGGLQIQATVFDWVELPGTIDQYCPQVDDVDGVPTGFIPYCDRSAMQRDAAAELAARSGVEVGTFDYTAYVFAGVSQGGYGGWGEMVLSSNFLETRVIVHEFGHIFGLAHSGYWMCGEAPENVAPDIYEPRADGCRLATYGSGYCAMAAGLYHYNMLHQIRAGFLDESYVQRIEEPGTYTLQALGTAAPTGPLALRIPLYRDVSYLLEYRRAQGFDGISTPPDYASGIPRAPFVEGVAVWFIPEDFSGLDSYSVETGPFGAPLIVRPEEEFHDQYRGVRVRWVEQVDAEHARVSIEFEGSGE